MKNGKALHKIIGCGVVMLAVFVFAGTGHSQTPCSTCQTCGHSQHIAPAPPVDKVYAELEYRDGFPGNRMHKRHQVKKLQCMLRALGYCSGPIDGWYGNSTARGVMLFLADNFQEIGYGKKVTEDQWNYLVNWVGERCSKYDKNEEPKPCQSCPKREKPQYYQYQDYQQGQQYQYYQYK